MFNPVSYSLYLLDLPINPSTTCISGEFDAITRTSDGNTYSFKDEFVLQFNQNGTGVLPGFPKKIFDVFPGLPSNLDAAVNWVNGNTYFFKVQAMVTEMSTLS